MNSQSMRLDIKYDFWVWTTQRPPPNYPGKASENKQYKIGVAKFEDSLKLYSVVAG